MRWDCWGHSFSLKNISSYKNILTLRYVRAVSSELDIIMTSLSCWLLVRGILVQLDLSEWSTIVHLLIFQPRDKDGKQAGQVHYENLCMKAVNQSIGKKSACIHPRIFITVT